jgi:predicted TIM-barrel fold metal-dependent hydrolase
VRRRILDRFDWLARRHEEPVDPERVIVDPHHHLWDRGGSRYGAEELHADAIAGHNVVETVFVECMSKYDRSAPTHLAPVGETRYVAAEAARADALGGPRIGGIVGFADLMLGPAVEEVLVAHEEAGAGRFRGIRHATAIDDSVGTSHTDPAPAMMLTPEFRAGLRALAARGHSFDAWLFHPQLPELVDLARAVPEATIVLDHLGAPLGVEAWAGRRDEVDETLRSSLQEVAACPNVVMKVGGVGMDFYYGTGWTTLDAPPSSDDVVARWGDLIRWTIDVFGPDRCMFESNFPVDRETLPYTVLWNAFQKIGVGYTADEQDELFAGTARRTYRLA